MQVYFVGEHEVFTFRKEPGSKHPVSFSISLQTFNDFSDWLVSKTSWSRLCFRVALFSNFLYYFPPRIERTASVLILVIIPHHRHPISIVAKSYVPMLSHCKLYPIPHLKPVKNDHKMIFQCLLNWLYEDDLREYNLL